MMLKRIIYCLYYKDNHFYLSRNFRLQKVGDVKWLIKNFKFDVTANYVDELIVLHVKNNPSLGDYQGFFKNINFLRKNIFIPITLGGGISNLKQAKQCFLNGADKILINTASYNTKKLINDIANLYGSQSISIMMDYKYLKDKIKLFSKSGVKSEKISLSNHLSKLSKLSCGEIILNSIDRDGTGQGLDIKILKLIKKNYNKPILLMGGAGKPEHFSSALKNSTVSAIITANLFNFLGDGLKLVRQRLIDDGIKIAKFY
tara:strand:+ start:270 stop:1046 length:777 start_codon:yes stop_codon:yes gene_type:complete